MGSNSLFFMLSLYLSNLHLKRETVKVSCSLAKWFSSHKKKLVGKTCFFWVVAETPETPTDAVFHQPPEVCAGFLPSSDSNLTIMKQRLSSNSRWWNCLKYGFSWGRTVFVGRWSQNDDCAYFFGKKNAWGKPPTIELVKPGIEPEITPGIQNQAASRTAVGQSQESAESADDICVIYLYKCAFIYIYISQNIIYTWSTFPQTMWV